MTSSLPKPRRRTALLSTLAIPATACSMAFPLAFSPAARAQTSAVQPAQDFPSRPVTIVVPFPPGGGADTLARILAAHLSKVWNQQVLVDNRPGASGHIGASHVARSAPDGTTLMMSSTASIDAQNVKQFAPISLVSASPYVVAVNPRLGVHSIKELIARAKAQPGKLTYGSSGQGSASQMTVELFKQTVGVDMLHVPYKGTGQAVTDLLAGTIDLMFAPAQTVMPHVKAGKVEALAVTSSQRAKALPDLPTIAEAGVPGYSAVGWFGLLAPVATPAPIIARISRDVDRALTEPAIVKTMLQEGAEPATGGSPQRFDRFINDELVKWAQVDAKSKNPPRP